MPSTKNSHRLSTNVIPSRYKIMLKPDFEHFTFFGEETISISVKKEVSEVVLHANELEIQKAEIVIGKKTFSGKVRLDKKKETATITFSKKIPPGQTSVFLTFTGILNDKMKGFYRSKYDVDGVSLHMAVTQFESTDARRAFPCFDEPSLKAVFDVTLMIPNDLTAISNTIEDSVVEHEAGYKLVQFAPTPKMSTYLLAFIVGKFEYVEAKEKEVLIRVFVTPGKKKQAQFALQAAKKIISFYNEYFQIPYPLPVLDLIAIPDFAAGAMENWGAVTFRETALLVDEQNSSAANKQWVALVIAHELAHMWFGNLVTMEWWTHLWLNEGFACFIEYVAVDEIFPEFDIWTQFLSTEHNSALSLDGLKNTHPIEIPVEHPSEITEIFDEVSYAKGASIIKMLATYLGDTDFRNGLRLYLKTHAYQNATTEHLWDAFSKVSKKDIKTLMKNWTQKPGYPVVIITEKQKTLQLLQKRFYSNPLHAKKTQDKTIWNIPLIMKTSESKNVERSVFKTKTQEISKPKEGNWITINATEASFIRVAYPQKYIENFKKGIVSGDLLHLDKIGLLRDVFDLSQAGLISTTEALTLCKEYVKETDYTVWAELAGGIHTVGNLLFNKKELYNTYRNFAKDLFVHIATRMGWEKKQNEKHTDALLRSLGLYGAGTYGDKNIVSKAKLLFNDFINGKYIDPDIRGVVYALIAENGGEAEYKQLQSAYKKEPLHQEKDRIARGLASFTDQTYLGKVLAWSITEDVRAQDAPRFLYAVFANPNGRDIAWEFLTHNWGYYSKKFAGSHGFSRVIEGAANFTSEEKAKEVEKYFALHSAPELKRTIKQVIEQIYTNAAWLQRDKEKIKKFLPVLVEGSKF